MKIIALSLTLIISTFSCLSEKGGTLLLSENVVTDSTVNSGTNTDPLGNTNTSAVAGLCGLTEANQITSSGEVYFDS